MTNERESIGMPRWMTAELPAAIFVVTFAFFTPTLWGEFVSYDDEMNFLNNPNYRGLSWSHLKWMWTNCDGLYIPLSWMTLGLDYILWGLRPFGYHFTSILLHSMSAALFYFVLLGLLGNASPRAGWAAAAGALFFAIHPLRVESVAWITERRDVLCGLFFMLTMLAYLRMAREEEPAKRLRWYALSLLCFALSLLSKAAAMALPIALIVLDAYPLRRFIPGRRARLIAEKLPFLAITLAIAAVAFLAQRHAGAVLPLTRQGPFERGLQAAYGLCFYVSKTLVPLWLSPIYLRKGPPQITDPRFIASVLLVVGITAALIALRGRRPELLAAWACYALLVSPVLGFMQVGPHLAADRYTYLPCLAWAALAAAALLRRGSPRVLAGAACALAVLGALSVSQASVWADSFSLVNQAIRVDPGNYLALYGRSQLHMRKNPSAAIADLDHAIEANPNWADLYWHRAAARARLGDVRGALDDWIRTLETGPADWPHRAAVQQDIESARRRLGNP